MKKNWLPLVLIVGFILAWENFVLRPYNQKQRDLIAQTHPEKKVLTPGVLNQTTNAPTASPGSAPELVAAPSFDSSTAVALQLSEKRQVMLFGNGAIGRASFDDYRVREKAELTPTVLMNEPLFWGSSNKDVNTCLASLKKRSNELTFSGNVGEKLCTLSYTVDSNIPGVLQASLELTGFEKAEGFVSITGNGEIGVGPQQEHNFLMYTVDKSKHSIRDAKLLPVTQVTGAVSWLVWGDRYFATALIPKGKFNPNVVYGTPGATALGKTATFSFQYPLVSSEGTSYKYELGLFFGTRDSDVLASIQPDLKDAVDLGIFASVARLMLWLLQRINLLSGNFGVSIILLTLLVRVLFWPLNKKVYDSGLKMKALQPEIEKLRAKYGSDKARAQEMNVEMMGLYKRNKVNPVGSCMPMLLQMPIFLGLYGALNHSLDLYQAPFFGWIGDLSSKDPFFVFPALWTISLLAYVKLNPTPKQPGQPDMKWIMISMNVFFGFLSKDWPAGLTLYLFVSNLVGITQQVVMQRAAKLQPIQEGV